MYLVVCDHENLKIFENVGNKILNARLNRKS